MLRCISRPFLVLMFLASPIVSGDLRGAQSDQALHASGLMCSCQGNGKEDLSFVQVASVQNESTGPFLAMGVKVGEVSSTSAVVWARLTKNEKQRRKGYDFRGTSGKNPKKPGDLTKLWGACPGASGRVRVRYGQDEGLAESVGTGWAEVSEATDFTHQFKIEGLTPGAKYFYCVEAAGPQGDSPTDSFKGSFRTAPPADKATSAVFTAITGQGHRDLTHDYGYEIYRSMRSLNPNFFVPTGDTVYLDSDWPRTTTPEIAHYHWQRSGSLPRHIKFRRQTPGYWMKDDHDVFANDCWPTLRVRASEPFTYEDGKRIFREQTPMSEKTYRTFRWGKDLQIWFLEARDFRTPNDMPDGPEKTLWGKDQKDWLFRTLGESDATWKVIFSPTPIVGPPRQGKFDNHSSAFIHEGDKARQTLAAQGPNQTFVVCGDIHYQYHSVDPETGLHEFSTGPASDKHSGGLSKKNDEYHQFVRVKGGFLSAEVSPLDENKSRIRFRFHSEKGKEVYQFEQTVER